jgi:NAD kinase
MKIKAIFNPHDIRQSKYITFLEQNFPEILTEKNPDLFYVLGGDGAMMHAHSNNQNATIPFFGKGLGTVNFIMNNFSSDKRVIEGLLSDKTIPDIVEVSKINISVNGTSYESINDIIIGGAINGWHEFIINSERGSFNDFSVFGSGLCISTALGSTGFNLNNHGKMIPIDSDLWSFTSIASGKNINEVMKPQGISIIIGNTRNNLFVYVDGDAQTIKLSKGDEVIISKSMSVFKIAFIKTKLFYGKRMALQQTRR